MLYFNTNVGATLSRTIDKPTVSVSPTAIVGQQDYTVSVLEEQRYVSLTAVVVFSNAVGL